MASRLGLVDTHTHLSSEEFNRDREEMISRALDVCDYLIDIGSGTSPDAFVKAARLSESYSSIFFTAGIHPHDAETLGSQESALKAIEDMSTHPKCVAIGECGLDYYYKHSDPEIQKKIFEWHMKLAQKRKLPLTIHTRDAEADTQAMLRSYDGPAIFHCFTGTQELADFGVQKGFMISFSGIVTFKNADDLRKVFLSVPLEHIVIETDSPYLAPIPMRGKRCESSFIEHTARFLAELRGVSFKDFARQTKENALKIFQRIT